MTVNANTTAAPKEFLFKGANAGTSKAGKPFSLIQLHDPETLENVDFFLPPGKTINTAGLKFKDRVVATFGMGIFSGRPQIELESLTPVKF